MDSGQGDGLGCLLTIIMAVVFLVAMAMGR